MVLNDVVTPIIADAELGREHGGSSEFSSWCSGHRFLPQLPKLADQFKLSKCKSCEYELEQPSDSSHPHSKCLCPQWLCFRWLCLRLDSQKLQCCLHRTQFDCELRTRPTECWRLRCRLIISEPRIKGQFWLSDLLFLSLAARVALPPP